MSKWDKLLERILAGESDAAISFDDACHLLQRLGWKLRIRGSHHWFHGPGLTPVNLQPSGRHVKRYQVEQLRAALIASQHPDEH